MNAQNLLHLVWITPLAFLAIYIGSPRFLGTMGLARVRRILDSSLEKRRYSVLHDLLLPSGGGTFHVDHLVLSRWGICVIDSIHRSGWISGTEVQARWQQKSWRGTTRFDNPIHVNYLEMQALERLLQLPASRFLPMVAWSGHKGFKKGIPRGVVEVKNLVGRIRSLNREMLTSEEVDRALLRLQESIIRPGLFGRVQKWKLLRVSMLALVLAVTVVIYQEPLYLLYSRMQRAADIRMAPENFHPDGQPKSEIELWEDRLNCAWSQDLERCACYEPGGKKVTLAIERCRELAERGSILKQ
jgi:hypothetical protein